MDAKGNGNDGVREYRVGARLIKRDSCRQFDAPVSARSAKPKSPSKSSAAKSSASKPAKV
jgi:LacI family transcriptional regulator